MKRPRLTNVAAGIAAALYLGCFPAFGQATASQPDGASKKAGIASPSTRHISRAKKHAAKNTAHVYLLRGLMNIFSLGMDELAQKIEHIGIAATVANHSDWQEMSDRIAAKYKAGNHGAIILIGHSLGADAVMLMGEYLGKKGVPVALIVPFDGTASHAVSGNVARVLNITQRDYAYMKRGYGFRGELTNLDVSGEPNMGHISIDKSPRLHNLVLKKIASIVKKEERGEGVTEVAAPDPTPPTPVPAPLPMEGDASPQPAAVESAKPARPESPATAEQAVSQPAPTITVPAAVSPAEVPAITTSAAPATAPPGASSPSEISNPPAQAPAPVVSNPPPQQAKAKPVMIPLEFRRLGPQSQ